MRRTAILCWRSVGILELSTLRDNQSREFDNQGGVTQCKFVV